MPVRNYRKKPVVVQALQFDYTPEGINEMKAFLGKDLVSITKENRFCVRALLTFQTNHGMQYATEGDFVVRESNGDTNSYMLDYFINTYEPEQG